MNFPLFSSKSALFAAVTCSLLMSACAPRNYHQQANYPQRSAAPAVAASGVGAATLSPDLPTAVGESVPIPAPGANYETAVPVSGDVYSQYGAATSNEVTGSIGAATAAEDMIPEYVKNGGQAPAQNSGYDAYGVINTQTAPVTRSYQTSPIPDQSYIAPVAPAASSASVSEYQVQPGDTVYSIGRKFSVNPNSIMQLNNMDDPNRLSPGQKLRISGASMLKQADPKEIVEKSEEKPTNFAAFTPSTSITSDATPAVAQPSGKADLLKQVRESRQERTTETASVKTEAVPAAVTSSGKKFSLPVNGKVTQKYASTGGSGGAVKFAVKDGEAVKSSAAGEVIYVGNIKGYGKMILVRHPEGWVTNYARLKDVKVKQGDKVAKGATIATGGRSAEYPSAEMLFELRQGVKTVDPLKYAG